MISVRPFLCWRTCCRSRRATAIRPLNLTPQKRKEKTLHAQLAQLEGLAARQPVLMVWEDVHWSDPTTRESLDLLIDRVPTLRVLMILTFRPEFTPPWIGRPHVTMLTLNRLPRRQGAEMIAYVTGGKALPKEIADQIVDRTDGVPLFIEELTKIGCRERHRRRSRRPLRRGGADGTAGDPDVAACIAPGPARSPGSDTRGGADRRGARAFVLARADQRGREECRSRSSMTPWNSSCSAELIFRRGTPPDAEYTFKHALVQDAAYSTLLRSRRQQLHARIATTLESRFPEIVAAEPAILAQHCTERGSTRRRSATGSRPASSRRRARR